MEPQVLIKENWFTQKPRYRAKSLTLTLTFILFSLGIYYVLNVFDIQSWMTASGESVFTKHEYWRLWTTLFAHADFGHLLNNALLFVPLTYLLAAYFGFWFFPVTGLFLGGITNAIVLATMSPQTQLVGISGVVYWMGGAWFTLFLLLDHRKSKRYRAANVIFLMMMLFIPENYWPHISYLAHFIGFIFGVLSAMVLYVVMRKHFLQAQVVEYIFEENDVIDMIMDTPSQAAEEYQ